MRLLGAKRLSRDTDESTSIERQGEQIEYTAKARGDELVHVTEDTDVSGAVSPFERDQLGPWLTDPALLAQWDGLIVAKLDRLSRSLRDFVGLYEWCKDNKKTIISVAEGIDFSTPMGRMFANILIMFAEFERERMGERRKEAFDKLYLQGYYQGGVAHYGYKPVKEGDRWVLAVNEAQAETINWMADQILEGRSRRWVADQLNAKGAPTPDDAKEWRGLMVGRLLSDPVINGRIVSDGKIVLGGDGMPLRRQPVIGDEKWIALQTALAKTTQKATTRYDTSMLTSILFCQCGSPMYAKRQTSKGRLYEYYSCYANCGKKNVRMEVLDKAADQAMTIQFGHVKLTETIIHHGDDHSKQLAAIGQQIADLGHEKYVKRIVRDDYGQVVAQLEAEYARLDALPADPDVIEQRPTGQTVKDVWPGLDPHGKRRFLIDYQVEMTVIQPGSHGPVDVHWKIRDYEGFMEGLQSL